MKFCHAFEFCITNQILSYLIAYRLILKVSSLINVIMFLSDIRLVQHFYFYKFSVISYDDKYCLFRELKFSRNFKLENICPLWQQIARIFRTRLSGLKNLHFYPLIWCSCIIRAMTKHCCWPSHSLQRALSLEHHNCSLSMTLCPISSFHEWEFIPIILSLFNGLRDGS